MKEQTERYYSEEEETKQESEESTKLIKNDNENQKNREKKFKFLTRNRATCLILICALLLIILVAQWEHTGELATKFSENRGAALGQGRLLFKASNGENSESYHKSNRAQVRSSAYLIEPDDGATNTNVIECDLEFKESGPFDFGKTIQANASSVEARRIKSELATTTLFIVINSRTQNFQRRRQLRSTWLNATHLRRELCPALPGEASHWNAGAPQTINQLNRLGAHKARIVRVEWLFALGHVPAEEQDVGNLSSEINAESVQFNDLLILNLNESYRNLTLKHLAIFQWLLERGQVHSNSTRQLLIKCDDDAQLDLAQMISKYALESDRSDKDENLLMCAQFGSNSPVSRLGEFSVIEKSKKRNKWALTRQEWPEATFPAYCSGLAYLASMPLVEKLLKLAREQTDFGRPLWIDDVYVTGVLISKLMSPEKRMSDYKQLPVKIIKLNAYFCYTKAQKLHRESLEPGLRCMAYEDLEN